MICKEDERQGGQRKFEAPSRRLKGRQVPLRGGHHRQKDYTREDSRGEGVLDSVSACALKWVRSGSSLR